MPDVLSMAEVNDLLEAVDKPLDLKMVIEPGKFYRTRGGHKVRVYAVDAGGHYPVHGAIMENPPLWSIRKWDDDGVYEGRSCSLDIVAPWIDPPEVEKEERGLDCKLDENSTVMVGPLHEGNHEIMWKNGAVVSRVLLSQEAAIATAIMIFTHLPDDAFDLMAEKRKELRDSLAVRPGYEGEKENV